MEGCKLAVAALFAGALIVAGCGAGSGDHGVAPEITSTAPPSGSVGVEYTYAIAASGDPTILYALVSGPPGMRVDGSSGLLRWTPPEEGEVPCEVSATNATGSDRQSFEITVEPFVEAPRITSDPATAATVDQPYRYEPTVIAAGNVTWSAPVAPVGMTIDSATGEVNWTPTQSQVGNHAVTIRVVDEIDAFDEQSFTVAVLGQSAPAFITSTPPSSIFQGEVLSYDAVASGAPTIRWSLETPSSGTPAVGVIISTDPPVGSAASLLWDTTSVTPGEYTLALQVSNDVGEPDRQEFTVTVEPRPPVPVIDLISVPPPTEVVVGSSYSYDVELTPASDSARVQFSLDASATIPSDLAITIDVDTGLVSFTASVPRGELRYSYTVRATNVLGEFDEKTIVVDAVFPTATPVLGISPTTSFTLEVGQSFAGASATATGNPSPTLSLDGTLPDFLDFDPLTGLLSASTGKPAPTVDDIGDYSFDVVATNSEGQDRARIDISVLAAAPRVDSITPAAGRRQSDVPVVVRGDGFLDAATPTIVLKLGPYSEELSTTLVDDATLTGIVPAKSDRPAGVFDVIVDQGSTTTLAKRFTVTAGVGSTLGGIIDFDLVLLAESSPYRVTGDVRVENGATVTLEPGAVLMFDGGTNRRFDVGVNGAGALVAEGGQPGVGDQIVLTRYQDVGGAPPTGHYRGLRFGPNVLTAINSLRNVVVEFGGGSTSGGDRGAVEVQSGSAPRIIGSLIRESISHGVYAESGSGSELVSWFDENQLIANARSPISIVANDVSTLGPSLTMSGNTDDHVFVRGTAVTRAIAAWHPYDVPFFLDNTVTVRGVLNLRPGTELRFDSGRRLQVASESADGTLVAVGTPEAPIRMVPHSDTSGDWGGIVMDDRTQPGTVLRNVRVLDFNGSADGGLRVDNPENPGEFNAIVEGCLFQSSDLGSVGVYLQGSAGLSSFENNAIDTERFSVDAPVGGLDDVLSATSTYEDPLQVRAGTAAGSDLVWARAQAADSSSQPIRPGGSLTVTDGSLTIRAGNVIEMPLNGQLQMTRSRLVVDGTPAEPVVFKPAPTVPYWRRLRLHGPPAVGVSEIRNAVFDRGGGDPSLGVATSRATILADSDAGNPATPTIVDSTLTNSNGYGIVFQDQSHCQARCVNNVVTGSRFAAVRMHANFVGRFGSPNTLTGNNTSGTLGHEGIWVPGDTIDFSATWPDAGVPYVVQGNLDVREAVPADPIVVMTVDPGAELRFAEGARLRIGDGGDAVLIAQGTLADPISFTSLDAATPLFWRGIDFDQGADGSVLDHVVVSYGGRNNNEGNLNFRSGSVVTVGVVTMSFAEDYAAVVFTGAGPLFVGPATDRTYIANGQESMPGAGDPAFDCVDDRATSTCDQL